MRKEIGSKPWSITAMCFGQKLKILTSAKKDTVGKEEQNGTNFDFIALSREELSVWKQNNDPRFCVQEFDETKLHVCIKNRPNSIVGTLII